MADRYQLSNQPRVRLRYYAEAAAAVTVLAVWVFLMLVFAGAMT